MTTGHQTPVDFRKLAEVSHDLLGIANLDGDFLHLEPDWDNAPRTSANCPGLLETTTFNSVRVLGDAMFALHGCGSVTV